MTILPSQKSLQKTCNDHIHFYLLFDLSLPVRCAIRAFRIFLTKNNMEPQVNDAYGQPFMEAEKLFHSGKFIAAKPFYHSLILSNLKKEKEGLKHFFVLD